eukprot:m.1637657 g.1637657  ORF g.1637657 m.1637657 type:complete len:518 (-) comp26002_c0_seq1:168-1721(-)
MSDDEEFDEDAGGFGEDFEEEDEDDGGDGFGEDLSEDEEIGDDFGEDVEEEELDEDGAGWGQVDDEGDGEDDPTPAADSSVSPTVEDPLKEFSERHFNDGVTGEYSISRISNPLLKALPQGSHANALQMYQLVCQFMGITAEYGKSRLSALQGVQRICYFGIVDEDLRDELYLQICKQMNKNPGKASYARGVILLSLVAGVFAPTKDVYPIVSHTIHNGPKGFVSYIHHLLRRTYTNGCRSEPPCSLEMTAVKRKQVMRIKVIVNPIQNTVQTARLDPASVMQEWVMEICAALKIKNTYGWSIFINRYGSLCSLRGAGGKGLHVMDMISKLDAQAARKGVQNVDVSGQLSLRKEVFARDEDYMVDEEATNLIFDQIREGVSLGEFRCAKSEDYNEVAALVYFCLHGEVADEKTIMTFLNQFLPAHALTEESAKSRFAKVEKLHAKGEYSRRAYSQLEARAKFIKFALEKWGKVNSFSSDGSLMLFPNGKTVPRQSVDFQNPGGSIKKKPSRRSSKRS